MFQHCKLKYIQSCQKNIRALPSAACLPCHGYQDKDDQDVEPVHVPSSALPFTAYHNRSEPPEQNPRKDEQRRRGAIYLVFVQTIPCRCYHGKGEYSGCGCQMQPAAAAPVKHHIGACKYRHAENHIPERQRWIAVKCPHHHQEYCHTCTIPEPIPDFAAVMQDNRCIFQTVYRRCPHHPEHAVCGRTFCQKIHACQGIQTTAPDEPFPRRPLPARRFHQQVNRQKKEKRKSLLILQPGNRLRSRANGQYGNTESVFLHHIPYGHNQHIPPYNHIVSHIHAQCSIKNLPSGQGKGKEHCRNAAAKYRVPSAPLRHDRRQKNYHCGCCQLISQTVPGKEHIQQQYRHVNRQNSGKYTSARLVTKRMFKPSLSQKPYRGHDCPKKYLICKIHGDTKACILKENHHGQTVKHLHFRAPAPQRHKGGPGCHQPKCQGIPECNFPNSQKQYSYNESNPACHSFISHHSAYYPELEHCKKAEFTHKFVYKPVRRVVHAALQTRFSPVNLISPNQKKGVIHHTVHAIRPFKL